MHNQNKPGIEKLLKGVLLAAALTSGSLAYAANPPAAGDSAPDFALKTLDDQSVELHKLTAKSNVALIVLRGWPGYQCPICERQISDMIRNAAKIKERNIQMLFVYPGPVDQLKAHAQEFLQNKDWPKDFLFVIDSDFAFTMSYGLRWDAPNETAYPSTFIIDSDNKVRFAHISKTHGGRVSASELLKSIDESNTLCEIRYLPVSTHSSLLTSVGNPKTLLFRSYGFSDIPPPPPLPCLFRFNSARLTNPLTPKRILWGRMENRTTDSAGKFVTLTV